MQPKPVPIEKLKPHPENPRFAFHEDVIVGIAAGLNGEMSPEHSLLVRPVEDGFFEIADGHHRWQAGLRKGLKELPCWVREMTDDEAHMILVTSNTHRELSSIEKARHCFRQVGTIKPGTRSGNLSRYAKATGWNRDVATELHQAGEVIFTVDDKLAQANLSVVAYKSLVAIHSLPPDLWPDFVEVMLTKHWTVASTEQAVAKAKAYLESPVTFQEFLPANQCALAIALGNKTALHIAMLARVADAATQYLQAKNPEKLADWLSWLSENMGADSWDLTKLEAKSREFMPEAPPKPVLPYRTVEKCFDDFWTLVATINNPNTPEHQGCGGIAAFCEGLEPSQRKELANLVMTQYEALQDWVEILKELVA